MRKKKLIIMIIIIIGLIIGIFYFLKSSQKLNSEFLKYDDTANKIFSGDIKDYSINNVVEKKESMDYYLKVNTFAFRFIMGLKQLGYTFVQDINNPDRPIYLSTYYKFLKENQFQETDIITKNILLELDKQLAAQEKIDKKNYEELKKIVKLQEVNPTFPNYTSKIHFYSLTYNFLVNLPEKLRKFENKLLSGEGANHFISVAPNGFYPPPNETLETSVLKSDCGDLDALAHEWGHNVDYELILPENQNEIDLRFNFFGEPFYKTDKSLDYYSMSWSNTAKMINNGFLTAYSMYRKGEDPNYPHPGEDFAETFSMYVTEGKIFRYLADKDYILKQKYDWMKNNIFVGIEYDTGNSNFPNYINPGEVLNPSKYPHPIDYSLKDFNYKCQFISKLNN